MYTPLGPYNARAETTSTSRQPGLCSEPIHLGGSDLDLVSPPVAQQPARNSRRHGIGSCPRKETRRAMLNRRGRTAPSCSSTRLDLNSRRSVDNDAPEPCAKAVDHANSSNTTFPLTSAHLGSPRSRKVSCHLLTQPQCFV